MAATTWTYTANMAEAPRAIHAGVNALTFSFNSGGSKIGTTSDVILLGKIPNGATVVEGWITGNTASTAQKWQLSAVHPDDFTKSGGTLLLGDASGTMTVVTGVVRFNLIQAKRVSLSADVTTAHAVLYLNCLAGTETVSVSLQGCIMYVCDGRAQSD
jgi:hypothetical protein